MLWILYTGTRKAGTLASGRASYWLQVRVTAIPKGLLIHSS